MTKPLYSKFEILAELRALARLCTDERRRGLLDSAADLIALGHRERTPQRDIADRLVAMGVDVRTEVTLPASSDRSRSGTFRVDIAVYSADRHRPVALCECKARQHDLHGRQRENYDGAGIPYIVAGRECIDEAVAWLAAKAAGA